MSLDNLKKCSVCGNAYVGWGDVCPSCKRAGEDEFKAIKDFLRKHPGSSIPVVAEALDVKEEKIYRYLREGRLQAAELGDVILTCESCGKPVQKGKLCAICQEEMDKKIQGVTKDLLNKSKQDKFYSKGVLDRKKGR